MTEAAAREIAFQCSNCGCELRQTIGRLKANEHMTCSGCGIGVNDVASESTSTQTRNFRFCEGNKAPAEPLEEKVPGELDRLPGSFVRGLRPVLSPN